MSKRFFIGALIAAAFAMMAYVAPAIWSEPRFDGVYTSAVDFDVGYLVAEAADPAILQQQDEIAVSRFDGAGIAYIIGNQPNQKWRTAADAYRHIDPGRLIC